MVRTVIGICSAFPVNGEIFGTACVEDRHTTVLLTLFQGHWHCFAQRVHSWTLIYHRRMSGRTTKGAYTTKYNCCSTHIFLVDGFIVLKWWSMAICSWFISATNELMTMYHYQMEKCLWWSGLHTRAT